jgi:hypothetical protein
VLRKPEPATLYGPAPTAWEDPDFAERFPHIHEWMSKSTYEDGSPRATATLTMVCSEGAFKLFFNDRDNDRSSCVNSSTFDEALTLLEAGLRGDTLIWTVKRNYNGNQGKPPY